MDWSLEIKRAENGFVAKWLEELEDDRCRELVMVFEETGEDGLDATEALLYFVLEHFGLRGSKHDQRRITIDITDKREEGEEI